MHLLGGKGGRDNWLGKASQKSCHLVFTATRNQPREEHFSERTERWKLQEKYGDFQFLHLAQYECCTEVQVCVLGVRLEMKGGRAREVGRSQNKGPYIPY